MQRPFALFFSVILGAALVPAAYGQDARQRPITVREGGVSEALQSIFIPPLLNAPFTATVHTEWVKTMADGGSVTVTNHRRIARDSRGHIFQERATFSPKDSKTPSGISYIQIVDPDTHVWYDCFLFSQPHTCTLEDYGLSPAATYKPETVTAGPLPNNMGVSTHEDLGVRFIEGVAATGTRDSVKYNAGTFGNDRPLTTSREFWFAESLGFNLVSEVSDPRTGKQTFTVTDIALGEPDPKLFELPEGFAVVDHRASADQPK